MVWVSQRSKPGGALAAALEPLQHRDRSRRLAGREKGGHRPKGSALAGAVKVPGLEPGVEHRPDALRVCEHPPDELPLERLALSRAEAPILLLGSVAVHVDDKPAIHH